MFPLGANRYKSRRGFYKRAEQGPKCEVNTEQGADWVRVVTKDECESFTKTITAIIKCPACRRLHFEVLKTCQGRTKSSSRFCAWCSKGAGRGGAQWKCLPGFSADGHDSRGPAYNKTVSGKAEKLARDYRSIKDHNSPEWNEQTKCWRFVQPRGCDLRPPTQPVGNRRVYTDCECIVTLSNFCI